MNIHIFDWNGNAVEQLAKLWADGHSASQIAKELVGTTRCAVIGKVHRLRLPPRAKGWHGHASPHKGKAKPHSRPKRVYQFNPIRFHTEIPADAPPSLNLDLTALTDSTCRWPSGDSPFFFCGALPDENSSYCPYHRARGTQSIQPHPIWFKSKQTA